MLFGVPVRKDAEGSEAWNPSGIGQQAIAALRTEFGDDAVVMSDLCLDEYTDHGHCGVLTADGTTSTTTRPWSATGGSRSRRRRREPTWWRPAA